MKKISNEMQKGSRDVCLAMKLLACWLANNVLQTSGGNTEW